MRVLRQRYELGSVLGRGGMGVVHRAKDRDLDRLVAVKIVPAESEAERERFIKEAKRTAQLRHPGIVEVFDVGHEDADAFLVMELLEGESLLARVGREPRMTIAEAVSLGVSICDALAFAHAAGFVHRDVKPANVFLTKGGVAKLLDFGVAKRIDGSTASESQGWAGTLSFMAPEQIKGERVDGRTDLYALGAVLYRVLAGRPVFQAENAASMVHQHLMMDPLPLRTFAPNVRRALEAVVLRLLAKKPADRFADATAAKEALLAANDPNAPDLPDEKELVLELDLDRREPQQKPAASSQLDETRPIASVIPLPIIEQPSAPPHDPELMPWMARVPAAVSKRVALYAGLALVINLLVFKLGVVTALFAVLALAGSVLYYSALRSGRA